MSDVGLGATLQLDIADALARIDQLQTQIDAATSNVPVSLEDPDATPVTQSIDQAVEAADTTVTPDAESGGVTDSIDQAVDAADTTVPVDADTTSAEDALAGLQADADAAGAVVPITADTSGADTAIEGVASEAEATEAVIPVSADTSEAEDAIGGLGDEAEGAGSQVEGLSGILEGFSGNSETATGLAAGLGSTLGKLGPEAAAGAAGVGAFLEITKTLVDSALRADTSLRRFDTTTGDFAENVKNINVGNLNGDLDELAQKLGTSHVELQDAASRIFQLGTAAGVAGPEVSNTTDQVLALSLRARALNPELASSGQVAEALTSAFARGGRALVPYGISLSAAEINAKALATTGKATAGELTVFEKATAGAQIATDKFGGSLKQTLDEASGNPKIQLDSLKISFEDLLEKLGTPLLVPIVKDLTDLEPVAEELITVIAGLVQSFTPLFDLIASLGPVVTLALKPLELLGKGLELANKPFELLADQVDHLMGLLHRESGAQKQAKDIESLSDAFRDNTGVITLNTDALDTWIKSQSRFSTQHQLDDLKRLNLTLADVAKLAEEGAAGKAKFDAAISSGAESKNNIGDLKHSFEDLQKTLDGTAKVAIVEAEATGSITTAQEKAALAEKNHVSALKDLQAQIDDHNTAVEEATAKYGPLIAQVDGTAKSLQALTTSSPVASAALTALTSTGVQPSDVSFLHFAQSVDQAKLSTKDMDEVAATLGVTTDQLKTFVDGATGALNDFVSKAESGLPGVADAFPTDVPSVAVFVKNLNDSTTEVTRFITDLQAIFAAGGQDLAGTLATEGVKSGLAYADALTNSIGKDGTSKLVTSTEAAVDAHNRALQKADDFLVNTFGPEYIAQTGQISALAAQAFNSDLDFSTRIRLAASLAASDLSEQGKAIAVIAANQGSAAAEAYASLFKIDDKTVAAGEAAAAAILDVGPQIVANAGQVANDAARAHDLGWGTTTATTAQIENDNARAIALGYGPEVTAATTNATGARDAHDEAWAGVVPLTAQIANDNARAIALGYGPAKDAGSTVGGGAAAGYHEGAQTGLKAGQPATSKGIGDTFSDSVLGPVLGAAGGAGQLVGETFTAGVADGMREHKEVVKVTSAAEAIVAAAEKAARTAADSHSPSRLFAALGRDLAAGTAAGMSEGVPDVVSAAEDIIRAAAQAHAAGGTQITVGGSVGATGSGVGGSGSLSIGRVDVQVIVNGSATPEEAHAAGQSAADGFVEQLDRRWGVDIMLAGTKAAVG